MRHWSLFYFCFLDLIYLKCGRQDPGVSTVLAQRDVRMEVIQ